MSPSHVPPDPLRVLLDEGWVTDRPDEDDLVELTGLVRRVEEHGRGWATSGEDEVSVSVSDAGYRTRENVVLRDPSDRLRGWGCAHDRAAGRMLLLVVVDPDLDDAAADRVADSLLAWGERAAQRVGIGRGLDVQQIDTGAFAGDARQQRWLAGAGYERVRTWWQMSRPVTGEDARRDVETRPGVQIRRVRRTAEGMPDEDDLRTVHDVLESAFADHFNSHEETFHEFVSRLREDPGHRWDHWWVAELDDGPVPEAAGALVGSLSEAPEGGVEGSYVEYIGVLQSARGRGVATSLLRTVVADAAAHGRDRVGLEVDADSPTGADALYVSMGWKTAYVTESWHRDVPVSAS